MTDDQIEVLLRRYALRGPDDGLESRVLTAAAMPRSVTLGVVEYRLLLAAAALVLAVVLSEPDTQSTASPIEVAWRAEVEAAAAAIGGDEQALRLAEMLVPRPEPSDLEEEAW